jgi:hypothetical protein
MSLQGHFQLLPHCNLGGRFSSMSRRIIARCGRSVLQAQFCIMHGEIGHDTFTPNGAAQALGDCK